MRSIADLAADKAEAAGRAGRRGNCETFARKPIDAVPKVEVLSKFATLRG